MMASVGKKQTGVCAGCGSVTVCIRLVSCSYEVINESDVAAALSNSRKDGCYVAKWCEKSVSSRRSAVVVQERVSLSASTD